MPGLLSRLSAKQQDVRTTAPAAVHIIAGGSSVINALAYQAGHPAAYDCWPAGWRHADLLQSREFHARGEVDTVRNGVERRRRSIMLKIRRAAMSPRVARASRLKQQHRFLLPTSTRPATERW